MSARLPKISIAEQLAASIAALRAENLSSAVRRKCEDLLVDVTGLCVTARNEDYVKATLAGCDDEGHCTAIGPGPLITVASTTRNGHFMGVSATCAANTCANT